MNFKAILILCLIPVWLVGAEDSKPGEDDFPSERWDLQYEKKLGVKDGSAEMKKNVEVYKETLSKKVLKISEVLDPKKYEKKSVHEVFIIYLWAKSELEQVIEFHKKETAGPLPDYKKFDSTFASERLKYPENTPFEELPDSLKQVAKDSYIEFLNWHEAVAKQNLSGLYGPVGQNLWDMEIYLKNQLHKEDVMPQIEAYMKSKFQM